MKLKEGLEHYFSVLKEEKEPNFLKTKNKTTKTPENASLEELWKKHEQKELDDQGNQNPLDLKTKIADEVIKDCVFCENRCRVNRKQKQTGFCGVTAVSRYDDEFIHHGEEPELTPSHTIFFTGCTLKCEYCQNSPISTSPTKGTPALPNDLAEKIVRKKLEGSKNVNFVGGEPTPHLHTILKTLNTLEANIPIIWNSNMYMSKKAMKLLGGTIDLYLGDFKYGNNQCAKQHSEITDYLETIKRNFKLANQQADILIRHLVIPNHLDCCTKPILEWVAEELGKETRLNLMFQYRPTYKARNNPQIDRQLTKQEKQRALRYAKEAGLTNLVGEKNLS
ncbi:radical SAM protein [archaeon SCG-AAA382B04]|nr:radical SAM protein [archaeon SCG-AAA382B04]